MLEVDNVEAGYGLLRVIRGISFAVAQNEILAIVGANGVGKTTLLNALAGQLPLWSGEVRLAGTRISHLSAHRVIAAGLALVPEGRRVFADLTVEENLLVGSHTRRDREGVRSDLAHWLDVFPILAERRLQPAGQLSGGEQQMLALARALMSRPKVLLLDEPSLGLAPKIVETVFEFISQIRDDGTTVVLVEQNARRALHAADRALVVQRGRVVLEGNADALADDPRVRDIYLGHTAAALETS